MTTEQEQIKRTARVDVRVLSAVSAFVSTEETRYYLTGVCVELEPKSTTYIATDGHRLIAYRDDVFDKDAVNTLLGRFIVPVQQCKAFKVKKDDLALGTMEQEDGSKFLTIEYADVGVTFKPIDGDFPDWRRVLPTERVSGKPGNFNVEILASFGKFSKALGWGLPFIAHNGDGPSLVRFSEDFACGVVMPMRMDEKIEPPRWLRAAA